MELTEDEAFDIASLVEVPLASYAWGNGKYFDIMRRTKIDEKRSRIRDAVGPEKAWVEVLRCKEGRFWEFIHWNTECQSGLDVQFIHFKDPDQNYILRELTHLRDGIYLPVEIRYTVDS